MRPIRHSLPLIFSTLISISWSLQAAEAQKSASDRLKAITARGGNSPELMIEFSAEDLLELLDPESEKSPGPKSEPEAGVKWRKFSRLKAAADLELVTRAEITSYPDIKLFSKDGEEIGRIYGELIDEQPRERQYWSMDQITVTIKRQGIGQILMDIFDLISAKRTGKGLAETKTYWFLINDNYEAWHEATSQTLVDRGERTAKRRRISSSSPEISSPENTAFWKTPSGKHLIKLGANPEKCRVSLTDLEVTSDPPYVQFEIDPPEEEEEE